MFSFLFEWMTCRRFSVQTVAVVKLAPQERVQKRTVEQVVNVRVEMQRQALVIQKVQETVQVQQVQYNDRIVNVPLCGSDKYDPLGDSTEDDEVPRMCLRIPEVGRVLLSQEDRRQFPKRCDRYIIDAVDELEE